MKKTNFKQFLLISICLGLNIANTIAQESKEIKIEGKVVNQGIGLESSFVELLDLNKEKVTSAVTDDKGLFYFKHETNDSILYIRASYYSLKTIIKKVHFSNNEVVNIEINLDEPNIEKLNEVTIISENMVKHEVNKTIYKVKKNDYLKNAQPTVIFNNIPTLSYDEVNGLLIENQLEGKIYIDGLESSVKTYQTLKIPDIDKIEIITTPSAKYGSEFTGGIVNVVTKKNSESFIKGALDASIGTIRDSYSLFPNLSFKNKRMIIKAYYSIMNNVQNIDYSLSRVSNDGTYTLKSNKEPRIIQQWGNIESKYNISDRSFLFANISLSKTSEESIQIGNSDVNSTFVNNFINNENNDFKRTDLNIVYQTKINTNDLFIKAKTYWYNRNNNYNLFENDEIRTSNTKSKLNEYSIETYYDLNEKKLLKKPISYSLGLKHVIRESNTYPSGIDFNQKIHSAFAEYNYQISESFSNYLSLTHETTIDKNSNILDRKYGNLLPTIIFNKKFKNGENLNLSFSKKIRRPGVYYLNDELIFLNPGEAFKGNSNLKPQKNYLHRISFSKGKKINFVLTGYYNYYDDVVEYNSEEINNVLINFYDNVGNAQMVGLNASIRHKLFKKVNTNISSGIQYNSYKLKTNDNKHINNGYSYSLTFSANSKIIKDKVFLAFNLNYKSPLYDIFTVTNKNPYTSFMLTSDLIKDKLTLNLSYSDLFNIYSKSEREYNNDQIFQKTIIDNKLSNISIGLSFNFGKKFNDNFRSKNIKNDDLMGN